MIIQRYFIKEILEMTVVATCVMVFILLCHEIVRYLGLIASGKYAANMFFRLLICELPNLFSLLLPLGFFISLLLVYGRFYTESEMVILMVCGFSRKKLFMTTMSLGAIIALFVAVLILWANPIISQKRNQLIELAKTTVSLQAIEPGRFQSSPEGDKVFYARSHTHHRKAKHLFVAQKLKTTQQTSEQPWMIILAHTGHQRLDPKTGHYFLVTTEGTRYQGSPGQKDFQVVNYKNYGIKLTLPTLPHKKQDLETTPFISLFHLDQKDAQAELHWRLAIPISVLVLALLAIPLSHIRPREGRFKKLFPALLLYIMYVNLLFVGRHWIENNTLPAAMGLWWVHGLFCIIALILFTEIFKRRVRT